MPRSAVCCRSTNRFRVVALKKKKIYHNLVDKDFKPSRCSNYLVPMYATAKWHLVFNWVMDSTESDGEQLLQKLSQHLR